MRLIVPQTRAKREPTIALINIVFLMLVFFMVAGTLSQPLDPDLRLVQTQDFAGTAPPDAFVLHQDGRITYRGQPVDDLASVWAQGGTGDARVVPDRDAPAGDLVHMARVLRDAGAARVVIVTEKALQ
ncbi:ExbD/TolR family protein [Tateyamaria sp. SN6-1]|uniref:ExbD/TolR family protein n=1 Tax=Tateyamaria sp. SN6-1 TaxID=3092148 RepID=UPI0039F61A5B